VIALGKACKPPKSVGSFMAGDTTELDSEVILECQQRKLAYNIVKVGRIIDDIAPIPKDSRIRSELDNAVLKVHSNINIECNSF